MALFRGAVFRHGGGALKQPIKQPTETLTSTLALMGHFPLVNGPFSDLNGAWDPPAVAFYYIGYSYASWSAENEVQVLGSQQVGACLGFATFLRMARQTVGSSAALHWNENPLENSPLRKGGH